MIGPPERAAGEQIAIFRSVGYAAFVRYEQDLDVLDLVFDSLVDAPDCDDGRRLRFAGHGVTVDVDVRSQSESATQLTPGLTPGLTVELRVAPAGPVVVESRGDDSPDDARLVSFLLRWPGGAQRPARTAWIML